MGFLTTSWPFMRMHISHVDKWSTVQNFIGWKVRLIGSVFLTDQLGVKVEHSWEFSVQPEHESEISAVWTFTRQTHHNWVLLPDDGEVCWSVRMPDLQNVWMGELMLKLWHWCGREGQLAEGATIWTRSSENVHWLWWSQTQVCMR